MAKQTINLGTMADNKSGDPLRTAFTKVNENFTELYNRPTGGGTGWALVKDGATVAAIEEAINVYGNELEVLQDAFAAGVDDPNYPWGANPEQLNFLTYDQMMNFNIEGSPSMVQAFAITKAHNAKNAYAAYRDLIVSATVSSGEKEWSFDNEGVLTLPANGTIKDSDGNVVIANLDKLVISGGTIGTTNDNGGWGGYDIYLAPNGEGYAWIGVPRDISAANGASLVLGNTHADGSGVQIITNGGSWNFQNGGTLVLPVDGDILDSEGNSVLNTNSTNATELYVVGNVDGNVIYSTDGITFSNPYNTGSGIGTLAVGPDLIVYTGIDNNGDSESYAGLYSAASPTEQSSLITGTAGQGGQNYFNNVYYFPNAPQPWVAVGFDDSQTPAHPILAYSADGATWNLTTVNADDLVTFFTDDAFGLRFTDIVYHEGSWVITADRLNSDSTVGGGIWVTSDITQELTLSNKAEVDDNFKYVEAFTSSFFSELQAFSKQGGWYTFIEGVWSSFDNQEVPTIPYAIAQETNLIDQTLEEASSGMTTSGDFVWVTSSSNGHIVFWPNAPAGPFVSLPAPYSGRITSWGSSATSYIDPIADGAGEYQSSGEKFTITNADQTEYNGTYYVDGSYFVFTDPELTVPFDTTQLPAFTGGTLTWSHGEYIDALTVANGYIYCANDDEQVFRGELVGGDTIEWTKLSDLNDSLEYWNTMSYSGAYNGTVTSTANPNKVTTVSKIGGQNGDRTPLDLTKGIQKLSEGMYSLADGQEGQIMRLVVSPGVSQLNTIGIIVANARGGVNSGTDWYLYFNDDIITLVFTDGTWAQSGGTWD